MKKICYCTTIPLSIECFFLKSAQFLHENTDWDISFICSYDEKFANSLPEYFHFYPVNMKRGIGIDGIKAIREIKKIFKREKFDMVQYSTPNVGLYASIAAKKLDIPIRNYHLMGLRYMNSSGILRRALKTVEHITCKNSTSVECVSKSLMHICISEGLVAPEKATVIWNGSTGGVDLKRFDYAQRKLWRYEIRRELEIEENEFVYGFVGRINKDKGVNELLEAFLSLNDGSKLLLVGYTSEIDTLDSSLTAKARKNKNIIFHSSVSDIERYYAAIDVLALPSYREGFGNVVIEAAAVGTPAIVSDIPGPTDAIIRGKTALTVQPGDYRELKKAMLEIRKPDYRTLGKEAVEYVRGHFDSDVLNEKILERKRALLED